MELNLGPLAIRLGKQKATFGQLQSARVVQEAFGFGATWAPEQYGNYYAISVPAYRAIKLRADAVAGARLRVYQRLAEGKSQPVSDSHPVQTLLDKANPWWTSADIWKATETYLSLWGTSYWWLERQGGQITSIWPLRPDRMRIIAGGRTQPNEYISGYLYEGNRPLRFGVDEIIWFRYFNPMDEYGGLAPVAPGRLSLDMGRDALRFNRNFFRNGAVPQDLVFTVQGPVTEDQVEDFYRRLEKRHSKPENAHRPMVWDLTQGGKPERLGLSQRDMEFISALQWTVEDAARIWGVPPPKLYSEKQSIYNNVKQADIEFYTDTISTEWRFLETEVTELLLPLMAPGQDLFCAFDTADVLPLQEALAGQKTQDLAEVTAGTMTINEFREKYGREAVAWGDIWWKPFSLTPTKDEMGMGGDPFGLEEPPTDMEETGRDIPFVEKALSNFERRLRLADSRFLALQKRLFAEQQQDVVAHLRQFRSIEKQQPDDSIFQQERWVEIFERRGRPLFSEILTLAAQAQAVEFGLGGFDPDTEAVRSWLQQRTHFWADRVNVDTAQLLMAELAEARANGESIPQIQQRIEKVFRFNDAVRSERIARTETLAASNEGHLSIYEQSGVVEEKMWLATLDERVRAAHAQAHRQRVPLGGKFFVGGEMMDGPGLGGDPANNVNCRCTVMPVLRRRSLLVSSQHDEKPRLAPVDDGDKTSDEALAELREMVGSLTQQVTQQANGHKPIKKTKRIKRNDEGWPIEIEEEESI